MSEPTIKRIVIEAQWSESEGGYWSANAIVDDNHAGYRTRVSPYVILDLAAEVLIYAAENGTLPKGEG